MKGSMIDFRNLSHVREAGYDALEKELGTLGAVYFIRQFSTGKGNYTNKREAMQEAITINDLIKDVREFENKQAVNLR